MTLEEKRAKHAAYMREYYRKTREKWLARVKKYRDDNKDEIAIRKAAYYARPEAQAIKKATDKRHYQANREKLIAYQRNLREMHPDKMRAADKRKYEKHKDKIKARVAAYNKTPKARAAKRIQSAEYRAANTELCNQRVADWARRHPAKRRFSTMKRHTAKLRAIPRWADFDAMEKVYEKAEQLGFEVDHIVPLQSPLVCGLHTWDNLQLLHPSDNRSKGCRIWPDMP